MTALPQILPADAEVLAIAVRRLRDTNGTLPRFYLDEVLTQEALNASPELRQLADSERLASALGGFKRSKAVAEGEETPIAKRHNAMCPDQNPLAGCGPFYMGHCNFCEGRVA